MKNKKEGLKDDDIQLLRTGMNDNANLLHEDELDEIFGGYWCNKRYESCDSTQFIYCEGGY
jgi:hypothetical protein